MPTLSDIRAQHPEYDDLSDQELTDRMYNKYYSDMPRTEFNAKIGYTPPSSTPTPSHPSWLPNFFGYYSDIPEGTPGNLTQQQTQDYSTGRTAAIGEVAKGVPIAGAFTPQTSTMTQFESEDPTSAAILRGAGTALTAGPAFAATGGSIVGSGLLGAGLGGGDVAAREYANTGTVNRWDVGKGAAVGAGVGAGGAILGKMIAPTISFATKALSNPDVRASFAALAAKRGANMLGLPSEVGEWLSNYALGRTLHQTEGGFDPSVIAEAVGNGLKPTKESIDALVEAIKRQFPGAPNEVPTPPRPGGPTPPNGNPPTPPNGNPSGGSTGGGPPPPTAPTWQDIRAQMERLGNPSTPSTPSNTPPSSTEPYGYMSQTDPNTVVVRIPGNPTTYKATVGSSATDEPQPEFAQKVLERMVNRAKAGLSPTRGGGYDDLFGSNPNNTISFSEESGGPSEGMMGTTPPSAPAPRSTMPHGNPLQVTITPASSASEEVDPFEAIRQRMLEELRKNGGGNGSTGGTPPNGH